MTHKKAVIYLSLLMLVPAGYGALMLYDATHTTWKQAESQPRNQWGQLPPNNIDELCEGTLLMWSEHCKALVRKQSYQPERVEDDS